MKVDQSDAGRAAGSLTRRARGKWPLIGSCVRDDEFPM